MTIIVPTTSLIARICVRLPLWMTVPRCIESVRVGDRLDTHLRITFF